jgi:hypothetical protein
VLIKAEKRGEEGGLNHAFSDVDERYNGEDGWMKGGR